MSFNKLYSLLIDSDSKSISNFLRRDRSGRQSASVKFYGEYPLYIALTKEAPDETILAILEAFPDAANVMSRKGEYPDEIASRLSYSEKIVNALRPRKEQAFMNGANIRASSLSDSMDSKTSASNTSIVTDSDLQYNDRRTVFSKQKSHSRTSLSSIRDQGSNSNSSSSRSSMRSAVPEGNRRSSMGMTYESKYSSTRTLQMRKSSNRTLKVDFRDSQSQVRLSINSDLQSRGER